MGARKVWHDYLPRLKYYNPAIPMIVNRTHDNAGPATLSIYMKHDAPAPAIAAAPASPLLEASDAAAAAAAAAPRQTVSSVDPWAHLTSNTDGSAKAPPAGKGERVVTINMKHALSSDILQQFLEMTRAQAVESTPEDLEEMERLEKLKSEAETDRRVQKTYRDNIKAEKKMLERARQEADALKQD